MAVIPRYTAAERLADEGIHLLGIALSLTMAIILLVSTVRMGEGRAIAAAAIYSCGLIAMFGFSAAYNLTPLFRWNEVIRRCDHSAIYVMIAGTFTPFALVRPAGFGGYLLLILVWVTAGIGVVLKLVFPRRFERMSLVLYLALGWTSGIGVALAGVSPSILTLLLTGGSLYSLGVIVLLQTRLRFHNAIWHAFVLVAALCHGVAVLELLRLSMSALHLS